MKVASKRKMQITVDVLMTAVLLLQMSYSIAGELFHEISGIAFFVLFILHHILSFSYTKALFKGKKSADRVLKSIVDCLLFIIYICMMISAVPLSKYIFTFLGIGAFSGISRSVHMLGAYWGFALIGIHIGFHLDIMLKKPLRDKKKKPFVIAALCAVFSAGLILFIKEGVIKYMLFINQFVYFDESYGLALFLLIYILIGGMFAVAGYLLIHILQRRKTTHEHHH